MGRFVYKGYLNRKKYTVVFFSPFQTAMSTSDGVCTCAWVRASDFGPCAQGITDCYLCAMKGGYCTAWVVCSLLEEGRESISV